MGAVVGEKIARGINHAIQNNHLHNDFEIRYCTWKPLIPKCTAKTSVKLAQPAEAKITLYFLVYRSTTGGQQHPANVRRYIIAEPGAFNSGFCITSS
jgi:acetyl-CoA carboxylase carboxyl transferase subunit beta